MTRRSVRPGVVVAVLAASGMSVGLQQTLMVPLLPDLPQHVGASVAATSWLVTSALLTAAVGTPVISRMADMYGKRRLALACLLIVLVGSVVAGLSSSVGPMIVGRAMQGVGLCFVPIAIGILRETVPTTRVASAVAIISATMGLGSAAAMPLSGLIVAHMPWRTVFWISAVLAAVLVVALLMAIGPDEPAERTRFDWVGAGSLSVSLVLLLLGVTQGSVWGWTDARIAMLLGTGLLGLVLWAWLQGRVQDPLVNPALLWHPPVFRVHAAAFLLSFAMMVNMLVVSQELQWVSGERGIAGGLGMTAAAAGMAMLLPSVAGVLSTFFSAWAMTARGITFTFVAGGAVTTVGFGLRVTGGHDLSTVVIGAAAVTVGSSVTYATLPMLLMPHVTARATSSINGVNSLMRSFGTALASAFVATIVAGQIHDPVGLAYWTGLLTTVVATVVVVARRRGGAFAQAPLNEVRMIAST